MTDITLKIENLVTFTEAASVLGVARSTVYNLVTKFKLHPVTIGNNRYLLREELEFLNSETEKINEQPEAEK